MRFWDCYRWKLLNVIKQYLCIAWDRYRWKLLNVDLNNHESSTFSRNSQSHTDASKKVIFLSFSQILVHKRIWHLTSCKLVGWKCTTLSSGEQMHSTKMDNIVAISGIIFVVRFSKERGYNELLQSLRENTEAMCTSP